MLKLVVVGTIVASVAAQYSVTPDIVAQIKAATSSWVPMEPRENPFFGKPTEELKRMFGVSPFMNYAQEPVPEFEIVGNAPDTFDSRTQWPNCSGIKAVRD